MVAVRPSLYALSKEQMGTLAAQLGFPRFRGGQVWNWLYSSGATSFQDMTNVPSPVKEAFQSATSFGSLTVAREQTSKDGTVKRLYKLSDNTSIESVLMKYADGRNSVCVSSQAGCAMRCTFCATGQRGFSRQLFSSEIFEQVVLFHRELLRKGTRVSNVVLMGMGEPLANLRNVIPAIERMSSDLSIGFPHITVSTVGLASQIIRLAKTGPPVRLAVSLHAATDEERSKIMPINDRYPLQDLMAACREYISITHSRVSFEFALIHGVNDSEDQARRLARLFSAHNLREEKCHVNVIPLNPTAGFDGRAASAARVAAFTRAFAERTGVTITVRMRRGIDIQAGCGQLAADEHDTRAGIAMVG